MKNIPGFEKGFDGFPAAKPFGLIKSFPDGVHVIGRDVKRRDVACNVPTNSSTDIS
jgi:hypothetical protein